MFRIHAAVEQLCTSIDEVICKYDPVHLRLHHDDRLQMIAMGIAATMPEYVIYQADYDSGEYDASPGFEFYDLVGATPGELPIREVSQDYRKPINATLLRHASEFATSVARIPPTWMGEAVLPFREMMMLICSGQLTVAGWDDDGILQLKMTAISAPDQDVPADAEILSAIGGHRSTD